MEKKENLSPVENNHDDPPNYMHLCSHKLASVDYNQPTIAKELKTFFKDLFLDTGLHEILMTKKVVYKEVFKKGYESEYLENILSNYLLLQKKEVMRYTYPSFIEGQMKNIKDRGRPYLFLRCDFVRA